MLVRNALVLALLLSAACACERTAAPPARAARTPTPLDRSQTGSITGRVRFTGTPPAPETVAVANDPTCAAAHPAGLVVNEVRVQDGALADALVYVARGLEERVFAVPDEPVVIDQRACLFVPRVAGVQVGQRVEFVNSDDTLHNVHGSPSASAPWNFGLGVQGARRALVIEHAEVPVPVRCEVHPWMRLDLGIVDHPYFAVTGDDGAFTLAGVPAGHYVVAAWHARLGSREQSVDVAAGASANVELVFSAR